MNGTKCGCDESKEWKARAVRAELSLRFVRQQLDRLLGRIDEAIAADAAGDPVVTPEGFSGITSAASSLPTQVVDWMVERVRPDSKEDR